MHLIYMYYHLIRLPLINKHTYKANERKNLPVMWGLIQGCALMNIERSRVL